VASEPFFPPPPSDRTQVCLAIRYGMAPRASLLEPALARVVVVLLATTVRATTITTQGTGPLSLEPASSLQTAYLLGLSPSKLNLPPASARPLPSTTTTLHNNSGFESLARPSFQHCA
jgi:hypothetical protein